MLYAVILNNVTDIILGSHTIRIMRYELLKLIPVREEVDGVVDTSRSHTRRMFLGCSSGRMDHIQPHQAQNPRGGRYEMDDTKT